MLRFRSALLWRTLLFASGTPARRWTILLGTSRCARRIRCAIANALQLHRQLQPIRKASKTEEGKEGSELHSHRGRPALHPVALVVHARDRDSRFESVAGCEEGSTHVSRGPRKKHANPRAALRTGSLSERAGNRHVRYELHLQLPRDELHECTSCIARPCAK